MSDIQEKIRNHLKLSNRVKEAVAEFLKENKEKSIITQKYFDSEKDLPLLCDFFDKKINIIKHKNEYFEMKEKVENAVKKISSSKIFEVAKIYNINCQTLYEEYQKFKMSEDKYAYNEKIPNSYVFTYENERSLLKDLDSWRKKSTKGMCYCRHCALKRLLKLASKLVSKNQNLSKEDSHKQPDEEWLYEFEMRYSEELSEYPSFCLKYFSASMSASQSSSIINVTNISEPSTSSKHQTFEQIELENDTKNIQEIIKIHERSDIRERITNLLNLNKRLTPAAAKILAKKDNLETVLQNYKINSIDERRILHNIIFIIEEHNTYLQEKSNYESAVNLVLFSGATIEYVAQIFDINPVLLDKEVENYKLLNAISKQKYKYDKIICTSGYLRTTYMEEYSLLEELIKWRKNPELVCSCRFCTLELLYNLITDIIINCKLPKDKPLNQNKIKQLSEEWFCEFEIRYRKRICRFKYKCEIKDISWTITWHKCLSLLHKAKVLKTNISSFHMEGCINLLQISNDEMMSIIREKIEHHLELSNRLEEAAEEIVNKYRNEETVAQEYGFNSKTDREILEKKIEIKYKKNQYLRLKDQIHKIFYLMETKNPSSLKEISSIPFNTLHDENIKYKELKITYKYDDYVSSYKSLTYNDEILLLEKLYVWKKNFSSLFNCTCQACALENVFYLNYIFAHINKLEPQIWKDEMIRGNWICEFEMRNTVEMWEFCHYTKCRKDNELLAAIKARQ